MYKPSGSLDICTNILKKQQDDYDGGSELFTPTLTTNGLCYSFNSENYSSVWKESLLHFVAFFHVASLFSTGVDNKKVGVDNEKALELTNSTVFHRGRQ